MAANREIIMDGFTMEDLLEEVQMQKELQERRNERRREFEIRADVLAFLDKKKYPNYMEARFDNDWLYSDELPEGLNIAAKDWPIARRLIKQLKNRDIAEHWVVNDETILTKPQFTGIPRNMIFDEREIHENWVPVQPTPPRITMDEIDDLDLYAARRLKYNKVTPNGEKPIEHLRGAETQTRNAAQISSQINVQKEYEQKYTNADHGLKTNILKLHYQTESCNEGLDLKKTPTQINLNKDSKQIDANAASVFKTDILKVHSQTENCNTGLDDLDSLLEDIPPYLPPGTNDCKVDRAFTKSTKTLASKTAAKQKKLEDNLPPDTDCGDDRALTESNKIPVRKTPAERREELEELDSILNETEHLNQSIYSTTHSDDTVDKRFRTDTPWTDELITTHSAGQIPTTKPFGVVDSSSRDISRRPNVPVDGRPKREFKINQGGYRPLPAGPDLRERFNNPDEESAKVYGDIFRACDEHRSGGTHVGRDKEVEYVKSPVHRIEDKTEASEVDSCQRKKKGKKKKRQRASKSEKVVSDDVEKSQTEGVYEMYDNRKVKRHSDEFSAQRDKGIHNQEEDKDSFQKNLKLSPWQIKKARQKESGEPRRNKNTDVNGRTRSSGTGTPVTERAESPILFPAPEPVGSTQPTLSRSEPSFHRRILNSLRNRLNRFKFKTKAFCCCS